MAPHNELDFSQFDIQALSPERQRAVLQTVIRQAHVDRAEEIAAFSRAVRRGAVRAFARGSSAVLALVRAGASAAAGIWRRHQDRRGRRAAAAQLYAMDDRALQDIGVRRGEIEFAVSGVVDSTRRPRTVRRRVSFASTDYASPRLQPAQRPDEFILARNGCAG